MPDGTKIYYGGTQTGWVSFSEGSGTFSGFQPAALGYFVYSIHGSFTNNIPADGLSPSTIGAGYGGRAYGFFGAGVSDGITQTTKIYDFTTSGNDCSNGHYACIVGESPGTQIGVIPFSLTAGTYTFSSTLKMSVTGYTANFSNTAKFYLSLPEGVTFTSSSGTFLSQATPITLVPEPASYAMLLAGLGIVGAVAQRRAITRT
jgi:hypothetical protein